MPSDVLTNRHMAKLGMAPQPVSWSDGPLSIHDVSKFFSVPIAEAALKLSVCGSVLQRICKENGIARWPYRKVTAGKSVEEIIEEGIKELASNPKVAEKQAPSTPENSSNTSGAAPPASSPSIDPDSAMNAAQPDPKRPHPVAPSPPQKSSQRLAQAKTQGATHQATTPSPHPRTTTTAPQKQQTKPASTLDDFKTGFPSKGLRRGSTQWWGSLEKEPPEPDAEPESAAKAMESADKASESADKALKGVSEVSPTASSLLVRTRKKASARGKSAMGHAVTRGYGLHQLGAKDAATLKFVFGEYLPKHWTSAFPPVP